MKIKTYQIRIKGKLLKCAESVSLRNLQFLCIFLYTVILQSKIFASTTLLDAADNNAATFFERVVNTFDKTIFPIVGLFLLLGLAIFGKNEQLCKILKTGLFWLVIVFIVLNCFNLVTNTLMWIVDLLKGSSASSVIPEKNIGGT